MSRPVDPRVRPTDPRRPVSATPTPAPPANKAVKPERSGSHPARPGSPVGRAPPYAAAFTPSPAPSVLQTAAPRQPAQYGQLAQVSPFQAVAAAPVQQSFARQLGRQGQGQLASHLSASALPTEPPRPRLSNLLGQQQQQQGAGVGPRRSPRFAGLPDEVLRSIIRSFLTWEVHDFDMNTVDSIFAVTTMAKQFMLVSKAFKRVAEEFLYATVHLNLPRISPNTSAFTGWLAEVSWKRERFRALKTLVVHYGELGHCPLVSPPAATLREPIDWHNGHTNLPSKPGQELKGMRGFRGTLRHLILDTDGDTFLLPVGLENLNWDELTSVTYAARRFSHTGITQNGGRKEPFPFRLLTTVKIYTLELDADVLSHVYEYLTEFGPRLKTLHFHHGGPVHGPSAQQQQQPFALELADIAHLCPHLDELCTEPPPPGARDADLRRVRRVLVGSPMVRGGRAYADCSGLNWVAGRWTAVRADEGYAGGGGGGDGGGRAKDVGNGQRPASGEGERERKRPRIVDASNPAAWD